MQEKISKVLARLKEAKISASKIENELNLSNGVLGKTAKGLKGLSEKNFQKVLEFFYEKTGETEAFFEEKNNVKNDVFFDEKIEENFDEKNGENFDEKNTPFYQEEKKHIKENKINFSDWDDMLSEFKKITDGNSEKSKIQKQLQELQQSAKTSSRLNARQRDGIISRCNNYLSGNWKI